MNRREAFGTGAGVAATVASPVNLRAQGSSAAFADRCGYVKTADGVDLFVNDWSKGRPIILTHAWPLSSDCWEQHAVALADAGHRVISYDRRGFGRSGQPRLSLWRAYPGHPIDASAGDHLPRQAPSVQAKTNAACWHLHTRLT